ncbi:neuronal calcium sensor 1-like isoform X2 [Varroa destructor]|uniref:EF-hand domain-containing protein n=1 Tax=Varroa destructor TaxID=109461 RepID=A0A7M7JK32_VARDE|nr:neuronal calcium sensor 1-like isoform X2 [Varroa destructor]
MMHVLCIYRYTEFVKDCPNGEMTKDEFAKLYGQFFPPGDQTKFVDYIFNVFDEDKTLPTSGPAGSLPRPIHLLRPTVGEAQIERANNGLNTTQQAHDCASIDLNGVITFKEFIRAISITTKGSIDEKLNWAFDLYDIDNDGFVTRAEMVDIVTAIYVLHGKAAEGDPVSRKVDQLFAKLDFDSDARISREEFCEGFKTDPWIRKALLSQYE